MNWILTERGDCWGCGMAPWVECLTGGHAFLPNSPRSRGAMHPGHQARKSSVTLDARPRKTPESGSCCGPRRHEYGRARGRREPRSPWRWKPRNDGSRVSLGGRGEGLGSRGGGGGEEEGASAMMVPAWAYPVRGFYFFFRNAHRLWHRVARFVGEVVCAVAGLLIILFTFTLRAQRGFLLSFLPRWIAVPGAVAVILLETAVAVVVLFQYRLESAQRKLFLDVLAMREVRVERASGEEHVWLEERLIPQLVGAPREADMRRVAKGRNAAGYLSQVLTEDKHPVMHFLFTLPLNFVPVVGNVLFCFLNSFPTAIGLHHYYYTEMKGLSSEEFSAVVHAKKAQYQSFGFVASAFSLIPGLDVILVLTNAVGAALWAADMEKTQGSIRAKWGLHWYDKYGTAYGTFGPSSSGEPSSHP